MAHSGINNGWQAPMSIGSRMSMRKRNFILREQERAEERAKRYMQQCREYMDDILRGIRGSSRMQHQNSWRLSTHHQRCVYETHSVRPRPLLHGVNGFYDATPFTGDGLLDLCVSVLKELQCITRVQGNEERCEETVDALWEQRS